MRDKADSRSGNCPTSAQPKEVRFMLSKSNLNRRSVVVGLSAVATLAIPAYAFPKKPAVLFVCQFGSVKSAIAREHFRKRAAERGIAVSVTSRGITPEPHLSAETAKALAAEGIDPERQPLRELKKRDVKQADLVVFFDVLPAEFRPKRSLDWSDTGSLNASYAIERSRLLARIDALLDEMNAAQHLR
jgi:Low molecular weight phosphotyrosine protein phosphatase